MGKKRRAHNQTLKAPGKNRGGPPPSKKLKRPGPGPRAAGSAASTPNKKSSTSQSHTQAQHQQPVLPFAPEESILLVGEGDLSFAASLVEHHGCEKVTATVLEKNAEELAEKYPQAVENAQKILAEEGCRVLYGIDARKMAPFARKGRDPVGLMERILFNFPHVGGKSTDVNRQVRYNQELLVDFFKRALPSLAPGGSIVVTLFEGEPYTLWNIRDLGRHSGLQVERSFKFQAAAYPGYHHARTLGVIKNKQGEIGGGWKGEERPARSYVFVRKDDVPKPVPVSKKRKHDDSDDEDSSDSDD